MSYPLMDVLSRWLVLAEHVLTRLENLHELPAHYVLSRWLHGISRVLGGKSARVTCS